MAFKRRRGFSKKKRSVRKRSYKRKRVGYRKKPRKQSRMTGGSMLGAIRAGGTIVRHSEYIADLISPGPAGFNASSPFVINAQNSDLFPWGHTIAGCFEQYKFKRMVIEYRTLCTEAATGSNPAMGSVLMGTKYDALDPNFTSKQEMANYEYSTSSKPSQSQYHSINCKALTGGKLFCRDGSAQSSANADRRLYDLGNFTIATVGLQASAGTGIGEIWVHYEVVLYKPVLIIENAVDIDWFVFTGATIGSKFGSSNVPNSGNTLGGSIPSSSLAQGNNTAPVANSVYTANGAAAITCNSSSWYRFPPTISAGKFLVRYQFSGTFAMTPGIVSVIGGTTVPSGPGTVNTWNSYYAPTVGAPVYGGAVGSGANYAAGFTNGLINSLNYSYETIVKLNGPGAILWFDNTTVAGQGAAATGTFTVIGIPSNFLDNQ